jgi:hypothetical protein
MALAYGVRMDDHALRLIRVGVDIADGPEKLRLRLHEQIGELEAKMQAWLNEGDAWPLRFELLPDRRTIVGIVPARIPPDLSTWGLLFAEATHTARSALNGLVSQLARIDGASPSKPRRVQCPVARTEGEWRNAIRFMESIPDFAVERIRAVQPFLDPNRPTFLELVADVDNDHKHDGVLIEAVAHPLAVEASGLAILTEGGGQARQAMFTGQLDFREDQVVYRLEFPNPVRLADGHKPEPRLGINLLFDHAGEKVNFIDCVESLPPIIDGVFEVLMTGRLPTGPGWIGNDPSEPQPKPLEGQR